LINDVEIVKKVDEKIASVAARTNYAKGYQNVRHGQGDLAGLTFESEGKILKTDYIAGIFNWITRKTWEPCAPIDWYSDDIWCRDQTAKGHGIYVSRAYIHHVGSATYGRDFGQCSENSRQWIKNNRPELYPLWFKDAS